MSTFFRIEKFLEYQWQAKTKYYLHSPSVYQFYLNVLEGVEEEAFSRVDKVRRELYKNDYMVYVNDLGTGKSSQRKVSKIAEKAAVPAKYGKLLYRLVSYYKRSNILELGTSLGVSSCYLALANPDAKVTSIDGSDDLLKLAETNFVLAGAKNVRLVSGNFDDILHLVLKELKLPDLVFFDGNHLKESTLKYFYRCLEYANENSIFVFDDIHWNSEMNEAWEEIKQNNSITLTIDVYRFGVCFLRRDKLAKENFVLRY